MSEIDWNKNMLLHDPDAPTELEKLRREVRVKDKMIDWLYGILNKAEIPNECSDEFTLEEIRAHAEAQIEKEDNENGK